MQPREGKKRRSWEVKKEKRREESFRRIKRIV